MLQQSCTLASPRRSPTRHSLPTSFVSSPKFWLQEKASEFDDINATVEIDDGESSSYPHLNVLTLSDACSLVHKEAVQLCVLSCADKSLFISLYRSRHMSCDQDSDQPPAHSCRLQASTRSTEQHRPSTTIQADNTSDADSESFDSSSWTRC